RQRRDGVVPALALFEVALNLCSDPVGGKEKDSFAAVRLVGRVTISNQRPLPPRKESPMIFADALPKIKTFLRPANLPLSTATLLIRLLAAFLGHPGRRSASAAAQAARSQARHRAQLTRFLARCRWSKDWTVLH